MRARIMAAVMMLGIGIGCDRWSGTPANRARHFIESQVAAETPAPAGNLAGRVALDYARAVVRQGGQLQYRVESTTRAGEEVVTIVAVGVASAAGEAPARTLRFAVVVAPDAAGAWRVARWSALD